MTVDTKRRYGFYATVPAPPSAEAVAALSTTSQAEHTALAPAPAPRPSYLYRARVVKYPEGSHDEAGQPVWDWEPPGWETSPYKLPPLNGDPEDGDWEFHWPRQREFKSRSSALRRKALLESFGAEVVIERSSRITWPEVAS